MIIFDGMSVLNQIKKSPQTKTCRDLAELFNKYVRFQTEGYREAQVIFDFVRTR